VTRPRPRPELQSLTPYHSSQLAGGRIFLHANENPYPPPEHVVDEIFERMRAIDLNRYPDPEPEALREGLGAYAGVDPSWIWIGDGSNEVLLQSCLAYGGPGRTALVFEPTYRMHYRQARMAGTAVRGSKRTDGFEIDIDDAIASIEIDRPDIVFVCSPNNPTGTVTSIDDIRRIADAARGLVIVDEAYFEFCGVSLVPFLAEHPNAIVVRTMSKAFRLANVRLGYGIASPDVLDQLRRVRMPYAQSSFTEIAARVALDHRDELLSAVPAIVAQREKIEDRLGELPDVEVYEGGANFVFFTHPEAPRLLKDLAARGIIIRDFTHLVTGAMRVTAGTPEETDEFLEAFVGLL
jgi:histidinol-phosphate aminotransferase